MTKWLIRAQVLPMTGERDFFSEGEIAVDGTEILWVGKKGSTPESFIPDRILEYPNDVVMPGLINTHTHAAMTLLRSYADDLPLMPWLNEKIWPFEGKLTPDDIYWGTALALCEMIRSGTTTMLDMYVEMDKVGEAVAEAGTRAVLSRGIIESPQSDQGLEESIRLVQKYHKAGEDRIRVMFAPHAPYTNSGAYLQKIKELADQEGVGLNIHIAETKDEIQTIKERYGKTPVQWLDELGLFSGHVVGAHCVYVDAEDMDIMARHHVGVAHNPESNMKLNSGTAPIPEMLQKGIAVGIGTDGASSNNNLDMIGEMRTAALQQKLAVDATALPAYQVLEMATAGGAEVLGWEKLGKLAPGYKADLIMIDMDQPHFYPRFSIPAHLVYAAHGSDVRNVMINGKMVMEERKLPRSASMLNRAPQP